MSNEMYETIKFERGFEYQGKKYAFKEGKLYRLPFVSVAGTKKPLKEIPIQKHGNAPYYRLGKDWKSQSTVLDMIKIVAWTAEVLKKHKDLPC